MTGMDSILMLQQSIRDFKLKLGVTVTWTVDCPQWHEAMHVASNLMYVKAVDHLKSLVVARLFELSKMNRAGTSRP